MAALRAHVVDIKYNVDNAIYISLYCRDEAGKLLIIRDTYRPNFYVMAKPNTDIVALKLKISSLRIDDLPLVASTSLVKKKIGGREEDLIQVFTMKSEPIGRLRAIIQGMPQVVNCFEADISLTRHYLFEKNLVPFSIFEAEVEPIPSEAGYATYQLIRLVKRDISFAKPVTLSISMFCEHVEDMPISAVSCSSESIHRTISWKSSSPESKLVKSEEELLLALRDLIVAYKPDVLLFEDDSCDIAHLLQRAKKYRMKFAINFDGSEPFYSHTSSLPRTVGVNEVYLTKMMHYFLDFKLLDSGLQAAYENLQGMINISSMVNERKGYPLIIDVLQKKAKLNHLMFDSMFNSLSELMRLLGLRLADLCNMSLRTMIEWILIRESIQRNHIVPNKVKSPPGISVPKYLPILDPVPGFYHNIAVVNLLGIYPLLIIKSNAEDILRVFLGEIFERITRIDTAFSKAQNENLLRRKKVLLRLINTMYDYLEYPGSRWHSQNVLEQLNAAAKDEIAKLIRVSNEKNTVVFSDHSELYVSVFSIDEYKNDLKDFTWLSIDSFYSVGFFLPREASKFQKRFALMNAELSTNIIPFTSPKYIASTIREVLQMILAEKSSSEITAYLKQKITEINLYSVPMKDLTIRFKLLKHPDEYAEKTTIYTVLQRLSAKGIRISRWDYIEYVMAQTEEPLSSRAKLPSEMEGLKYDATYYIQKHLLPPLVDALLLKGIRMEDIIESEGQSSLDPFI